MIVDVILTIWLLFWAVACIVSGHSLYKEEMTSGMDAGLIQGFVVPSLIAYVIVGILPVVCIKALLGV